MAALFVRTIQEYRSHRKYLLHEYVVMKDHVHLLITPLVPVERAVQLIKGGFSYRAGKEFGAKGRIWNHRFDGKPVLDTEAATAIAKYIRRNPVNSRMVNDEREYLYSSAHPTAELDALPYSLTTCESEILTTTKVEG